MTLALLSADQLRVCPLFQSLDASDLQLLLERQRRTLIGVDQLLVQEHDWGETIFLIRDGLAKVRCFSPDGEEVVLSILGPGDLFGEMALIDEQPSSVPGDCQFRKPALAHPQSPICHSFGRCHHAPVECPSGIGLSQPRASRSPGSDSSPSPV
jgi:hypothetical protein